MNILKKMRENAEKNRRLQELDKIRESYRLKTVFRDGKYIYIIVHEGHYVKELNDSITIDEAMKELSNMVDIDAKVQEI